MAEQRDREVLLRAEAVREAEGDDAVMLNAPNTASAAGVAPAVRACPAVDAESLRYANLTWGKRRDGPSNRWDGRLRRWRARNART